MILIGPRVQFIWEPKMFLNIPKKEKDSLYNSQIGQQWIIIIPQKSMIMNSLILPKFIPHVNVV